MLEYGWGNPSSIVLSAEENAQDSEPNRSVFNYYSTHSYSDAADFANPDNHFDAVNATPLHLPFHTQGSDTHYTSFYDSRAYNVSASSYPHPQPPPASMLTLEPAGPSGFVVAPKSEPMVGGFDFSSRIGLNLGGRTYFASSEDDFVNRLYRRSRILEPGSVNSPRCQAEGCNADLTHAKHYHRRHKVCEFHSKAATVIAAGLTQRFCQQCSRLCSKLTETPSSSSPHDHSYLHTATTIEFGMCSLYLIVHGMIPRAFTSVKLMLFRLVCARILLKFLDSFFCLLMIPS